MNQEKVAPWKYGLTSICVFTPYFYVGDLRDMKLNLAMSKHVNNQSPTNSSVLSVNNSVAGQRTLTQWLIARHKTLTFKSQSGGSPIYLEMFYNRPCRHSTFAVRNA